MRDEDLILRQRGIMLFSGYFEELSKAKKAKAFPWETLRATKGIPLDAINHFKNLHDSVHSKTTKATLQIAVSCAAILSATDSSDVIAGVLDVVQSAFKSQTLGLQECFIKLGDVSPQLPFSSFVGVLNRDDPFIQLCAAKIIACLICYSQKPVESEHLGSYFSCLRAGLQSPHPNVVDISVQIIQGILSCPSARRALYEYESNILPIALLGLLRNDASSQLQYQVASCFWLFTFDAHVMRSIQRWQSVTPRIIELLKHSTKEKIVRVTLAVLVNLSRHSSGINVNLMLGYKLLPFLHTLKNRKFEDEDILADLTELENFLTLTEQNLSTWDVYRNELISGKLEWSPAHTSELFWQKNAKRVVTEENGELIKALLKILMLVPEDYTSMAVACHDLGECSKNYPEGRREMERIGAKIQLMTLMSHDCPEIRLQALLAVQKFMTNSWDI